MPEQINVADLVVGIEGDSSGLKKTLAQTMTGATTWGTALGGIIATGFTSLVGGAAKVVGKAFKIAAGGMQKATMMATGFQSQLAGLNIAASTTGLSLEELHDLSLMVGGDTRLLGVSATGAADSMTNLFKAGLTASDVLGDFNGYLAEGGELGGALKAAIDLAAASELDMVEASDLAAITMATFGISAEDITSAMNNFVQAADASVADVSDLRDAMVNLGPTAAAFGFSLEDTNNALAILSTRGIAGAEAGTAIKSMLTNMMRTTPKVTGMLESLNVSLYDQEGVMLSLPEIMAQFQTGMAGMTDEQKNNAIQTVAGTFGMKAMQTLLAEGTEGWDKMAAATMAASNTQTQAAAKAATMAGAMEALDGTVETFWIGLGEVGLPILQRLTGWAADMASKYGPLVVAAFQGLADAAMPFIETILSALEAGTLFETVFAMLPEGMQGFITWLIETIPQAIATLQEHFATAQGFLAVFGEWFSQILPVAIQILADYWNLYLLPAILAIGEAWTSTIQPALSQLWSWLQERIPQAIAALASAWETYGVPFFTLIGTFISETVIPAFAQIVAWLMVNIPIAIDTMVTFWSTVLLPALQAAWVWIQENLIPVFVLIGEWLSVNIPAAIEAMVTFWNGVLLPAIQTVGAWIQENLIPVFVLISEWLSVNIPAAIATAKTFWETTLLPAIQTVWDWIQTNLIPIFEIVKEWLDTNIPTAIEALKSFWEDTLVPSMEVVRDFIKDHLIPLWEALAEFFDVTMTLAINALTALWQGTLQPALETIGGYLKETFQPAFEALAKFWEETLQPAVETLAGIISGAFTEAWEGALEFLTTAKDTILPGVTSAFDAIGNAIDTVIGWVKTLTEKFAAIKVPSAFDPGSPPPLFFALMAIGSAMRGLADSEIPALNRGLERMGQIDVAGRLSANVSPVMNDVAAAAQMAGGGGDRITNNNFNLPPHLAQVDSDRRLEDTVAYLQMAAGGA